VHNPGEAAAATSGDRDWHVIVSEPGLAKVFEAYLLNDLAIAAQHNQPPSASAAALQPVLLPMAQTPPFHHFFSAQTITGQMRLTPLLTPDPGVYVKAVLALIAGAQKTLHLQFQYIELPKTASPATTPFAELVQAVIDRQQAGVEVEIVMSEYETAGYLEQLQAAGLDVVNSVKIQNNVHNKGVIVDGTRVLVSSQNWSGDGVLLNRDAGLLIENVDAAAYFEQIFQHDWQYLAAPKVLND
jgi:phosphatidylserine/phosphatidylglycerophosphate/cardiolipin synthase-like enzyme